MLNLFYVAVWKRFRRYLFLLLFLLYDAPRAGKPFYRRTYFTTEVMANIEAKYHLNDPIMTQYSAT